MSLLRRMQSIVGDQNTVARYLFEKIGHVSFFSWVGVFFFHVGPLGAALASVLAYTIVGKIVWLADCRTRGQHADAEGTNQYPGHWLRENLQPATFSGAEILDTVFDLVVVALVPLLVLPIASFTYLLAAWLLTISVFSNNQWGSPS